jgi:MFS family permease
MDDGDALVTITGSQTAAGTRIESSFDYDGDGIADIAYADPLHQDFTSHAYYAGVVYVFSMAGRTGEVDIADADATLSASNSSDYLGQGLGGAALTTISLAIVLGAFPRRQQGSAIGIWGALGTVAAAVGPVLGGLLVTYGQWSWIFFVNIPIGIAAVALCLWILPKGERHKAEGGLDIPGMLISGVGLFCLTLALVEGDSWGWTAAAGTPRTPAPPAPSTVRRYPQASPPPSPSNGDRSWTP